MSMCEQLTNYIPVQSIYWNGRYCSQFRGILHNTSMTFIPVQVNPDSLSWLCIHLYDTGTKSFYSTAVRIYTNSYTGLRFEL